MTHTRTACTTVATAALPPSRPDRPQPSTAISHRPPPPTAEHGRSERIGLTMKARISWEATTFTAYTVDVSTTGMLLETSRELPVGASLRIEVAIRSGPGLESLLAEGTVVRRVTTQGAPHDRDETGYGIRFESFLYGRRALARLIADEMARAYRIPKRIYLKTQQAPRVQTGIPTFWREEAAGAEGEATIRNLSVGGAFLATPKRPPVGSMVFLWFEVPWRGLPVVIKGAAEVVRHASAKEPDGFAVIFDPRRISVNAIRAFVQSRLPEPPQRRLALAGINWKWVVEASVLASGLLLVGSFCSLLASWLT